MTSARSSRASRISSASATDSASAIRAAKAMPTSASRTISAVPPSRCCSKWIRATPYSRSASARTPRSKSLTVSDASASQSQSCRVSTAVASPESPFETALPSEGAWTAHPTSRVNRRVNRYAWGGCDSFTVLLYLGLLENSTRWLYRPAFHSGRMCGNSKTSRIEAELVSSITRRSIPMPSPAVGGIPYSKALT